MFRNAKAVPVDSRISGSEWERAARQPSLLNVMGLPVPDTAPLNSRSDGRFVIDRSAGPGLTFLSEQYDPRWRSGHSRPVDAFGWAVGFPEGGPGSQDVAFGGQRTRTVQIIFLALLWAVALWVLRRPAGG